MAQNLHLDAGWLATRKAVRQARRTTDPKLTTVGGHTDGTNARMTYVCKGCGKTSLNGGAFGFHVRSCQALDQFDIDVDAAPSVPAPAPQPWPHPGYNDELAAKYRHPCVMCGRETGGKKNTLIGHIANGGGSFVPADTPDSEIDERGDMGWFPVGSECAKQFPAGYLVRPFA